MHTDKTALAGKRVLVVDDCPQITRLLHDALTAWGAMVVAVDHPREALMRIQSDSFDLLLLDVVMPEMDGWQLMQSVRRIRPQMARRIILLTGDRWHHETVRRLGDQTVPVLYKPFNIEELLRQIRRVLRPAGKAQIVGQN